MALATYPNSDIESFNSAQQPCRLPWYAVRVRSNFEKIVNTALAEKDYETFLPTYRSRRRWSDRVVEIDAPLFQGYTFCRFDAIRRLPILMTPGVVQIIGPRGSPKTGQSGSPQNRPVEAVI